METKKCPYCAEEIALEAKKCKHCHEFTDVEYIELDTRLKVNAINSSSATLQLQTATLKLLDENAKWQEVLNPLMVQANQSTIITNNNIKTSNKVLKIIFIITAIISLGSLFVSISNTYRGIHKDNISSQLYTKDSLLKSLNTSLSQIRIAEIRHLVVIDSLKNALDSLKSKDKNKFYNSHRVELK